MMTTYKIADLSTAFPRGKQIVSIDHDDHGNIRVWPNSSMTPIILLPGDKLDFVIESLQMAMKVELIMHRKDKVAA
jgi:hypothetical protein